MAQRHAYQHIQIEELGGGVIVARFVCNELGLFGRDDAQEFMDLVDRSIRDRDVRAVVFTGTHTERFISHADLRWLQEDGGAVPPLGRRISSAALRMAHGLGWSRFLRRVARRTPLTGAIQLDQLHGTLLRMGTSSTIFVVALNGSALGLGAEISWACDLRLMADGDHFIGHPEVLLGFPPGAGGTQRLPRLVGLHRGLVAILEGRPFPAEEALRVGAIDEIVPADRLIARAVERAGNLAARPVDAIAAIKRAVNVGGSLSMAEGLHLEKTEFLALLPGRVAQDIMLRYLRDTEKKGELALYQPGGYDAALLHGSAALDAAAR
ncbi:MAG: enoyl-CoA hydratase/isomerase family protein [Acidimicrobiia bacterium]